MDNGNVAMCVFLGILALPLSASADDLTLVVTTDKGTYEFAEPILVTVTVWNNSTQTYTLAMTPFDRPATDLFGTKSPSGEPVRALPELFVGIKSPSGQPVRSQREYGRCVISRRPKTVTLAPGESYVVTFNLLDHYPEMHAMGSPHNFDGPGRYELLARYYLEYARHWEQLYEGIFVGPLESEPVGFVVKPLEGGRLEKLLEQLGEDDVKSKVRALSLLRRGGAVNRIPNLLQFLNEAQPRKLRFQAIYAIHDAPDPNAWETYAGFLDDPDRMIRCYMAAALGTIGNKAAGDALYEVTDPEKYPRSYWVAFEALVKIGDPRRKEVAALLKESAESPAFREMASKVFREQAGD